MYRPQKPSDPWRNFSYATTSISLLVIAGLIFFSDINVLFKVAFGVSVAWGLSNTVSLTKLLRDKQEYEDWEKAEKDNRSEAPIRQRSAEV